MAKGTTGFGSWQALTEDSFQHIDNTKQISFCQSFKIQKGQEVI